MARESLSNTCRDLPSGPMMRELRRWLICPRWQTTQPRWALWARALSERHGRVARRHEALELALVRRLALLQLLHQRWLVSVQRFHPQVNLAIHSLLRQTIYREQPRFLPSLHQARLLFAEQSGAYRLAAWPSASQPTFLQPRSLSEREGREQVPASMLNGDSPPAVLERKALPVQTPLHLVFQRLHQTDEFIRLRSPERIIESRAHTLVQRVARQSQRVEEMTSEPTTLVTRQIPAITPRQVTAAMMTAEQATVRGVTEQTAGGFPAPPTAHTAPWWPNATPMAAVNIEHITDQVMRQMDRRLTAWRERRGRI